MPTVLRLVRAGMAAAIVVASTDPARPVPLQHTDLGVVSFFSYFTAPSNVGAAVALAALGGPP